VEVFFFRTSRNIAYGKLQLLARMAVQSLFFCTTKVRGEFSTKRRGNEFFKKPSFTISSSTIGFSLKAFPHTEVKKSWRRPFFFYLLQVLLKSVRRNLVI